MYHTQIYLAGLGTDKVIPVVIGTIGIHQDAGYLPVTGHEQPQLGRGDSEVWLHEIAALYGGFAGYIIDSGIGPSPERGELG